MAWIDYTNKDFRGYMEAMLEEVRKRLPEWTDHSPNDPGIVILELLAQQLDSLSYYNDRVANEVFLSTATKRKSIINLCKLIGYQLRWATPARHYQVFHIEPQPEDTIIPAGFQVGTPSSDVEEPIIFETVEDLVIPAGATGLEKDENGEYIYKVIVEHGQSITNEYVGSVTSNQPNQTFYLNYPSALKDSIRVYVEEPNGMREWQRVDDFIHSEQYSMHYIVEMDELDRVSITFGNGVSGKIPTPPANIYVEYKIGGGEIGNVGAETITEFYDSVSGLIETFNPYGPFVLGRDAETIEEAKVNAPASIRTLDRYVTLSDYESGILLDYPEVVKAKAINVDGDVDLYLMNAEGEALSEEQKQKAMEIINAKKMIFTNVTIKDLEFVDFDIVVDIEVLDNYDPEEVKYSVEYVLKTVFSPSFVNFGQDITMGDIYRQLSIDGIKTAKIIQPVENIPVQEHQVPRLGQVTVLINGV